MFYMLCSACRNSKIKKTYNSSKDIFLVLLLEEYQQISQQEGQHIYEYALTYGIKRQIHGLRDHL